MRAMDEEYFARMHTSTLIGLLVSREARFKAWCQERDDAGLPVAKRHDEAVVNGCSRFDLVHQEFCAACRLRSWCMQNLRALLDGYSRVLDEVERLREGRDLA